MAKPIKISKGKVTISDKRANNGIKPKGQTTGDLARGAIPTPKDYIALKNLNKAYTNWWNTYGKKVVQAAMLIDTATFTAKDKGYGWVEVNTNIKGKNITANVRKGWFNQTMNAPRNKFSQSNEQVFYSKWIQDYGAGARFTARRHVEGMLKVAYDMDDVQMVQLLENVLRKSDKDVEKFWNEWVAKNSDKEILDYFSNSDPIDPFAEFDTDE